MVSVSGMVAVCAGGDGPDLMPVTLMVEDNNNRIIVCLFVVALVFLLSTT